MLCVGLGEALFDLLPSGRKLGGAPLNAALDAHQLLAPLGGSAVVASRVGCDALGEEVASTLIERGVTDKYLQRDPDHPTGTVAVTLDDGQPQYEIAAGVAWDYFRFDNDWQRLAGECSGVTFGTLAFRSSASAETITLFLRRSTEAVKLLDVNLRQQFFHRDILELALSLATIAKLNDEELPILAELCGLRSGKSEQHVAELCQRFALEAVMLTHGAAGLTLFTANERCPASGITHPAAIDADSIGAGDACAAAFLVGWVLQKPPTLIANVANRLGGYVASQAGGTPALPEDLVASFTV